MCLYIYQSWSTGWYDKYVCVCVRARARERVCACARVSSLSFRSWCDWSSVRSLLVNTLSYFSFQFSTTDITKTMDVLSCLWDGAYKRTLGDSRFPISLF